MTGLAAIWVVVASILLFFTNAASSCVPASDTPASASTLRTFRDTKQAKVAVSPGLGFGQSGEGYVRFALVENKHRIRQAVRAIRRFLREARS